MIGNALVRLKPLYRLYSGIGLSFLSKYPVGTNVFEKEWDLLIILDTARVDAIEHVKPEYEFIQRVDQILSVGSSSSEWMAQTFDQKYSDKISQTAYISANAWTYRVINQGISPEDHGDSYIAHTNWNVVKPNDFKYLEHAWRERPPMEHNFEAGGTPPQYIADRAIQVGREINPDRLIVHFIQPHHPHTARAIKEERDLKPHERDPWSYLRSGGEKHLVWRSYLDHLRRALNAIDILLNNYSADKAIISADHGEAFGELGLYAHQVALPHPYVRIVPWVTTSASDKGTRHPEKSTEGKARRAPADQLKSLGYV